MPHGGVNEDRVARCEEIELATRFWLRRLARARCLSRRRLLATATGRQQPIRAGHRDGPAERSPAAYPRFPQPCPRALVFHVLNSSHLNREIGAQAKLQRSMVYEAGRGNIVHSVGGIKTDNDLII